MRTILIANPKGGCGKTTLATNLAGYFSTRGRRVVLNDMDRQQSALNWIRRRPHKLPLIRGVDGRSEKSPDPGAEWSGNGRRTAPAWGADQRFARRTPAAAP